jgi:peptidyl-prolyl cis-trans isomerase B (cyclophilin B)
MKANDIKQLSDETKPHYLISVQQGGTQLGDIEFESFPDVAPKHCHNLDSLVGIKFYDSTAFHRVIPGFMIQGGDPNSKNKPKSTWGSGDPSQTTVPAEFSTLNHERGILSAARTPDPNSANSQFFICVTTITSLNGKYSIYGQVVKGIEVVDKIVNVPRDAKDNPNVKVEMIIRKLAPSEVKDITVNSGNIKIYPNPVSESLGFSVENNEIIINSVIITDITGKSYFTQNYSTPTNLSDIIIPVSNLQVGVYYINIKDISGKEYNLRFVSE